MKTALLLLALILSISAGDARNTITRGALPPTSTSAHGSLRPTPSDTPLVCGAQQDKKAIVETAINITASLLAIAASGAQIVNAALAVVHRQANRGSEYLSALHHSLFELTITRHGDISDMEYNYTRWHGVRRRGATWLLAVAGG